MPRSSTLSVAVLGAGLMGSNHARVINASGLGRVELVVDVNEAAAARLGEVHDARWSTDASAALQSDALVIAAPTETHLELGEASLRAGIPTLIEKPLAPGVEGSHALVELSRRSGTPLMCGFVERFNPVVTTLTELVHPETIRHFLCVRHSPPAPRIRADVIDDMLIHDLDLICLLAGKDAEIRGATCLGWGPTTDQLEVAEATVLFGSCLAHLSASRWSQHKIRRFSVATDDAVYETDLLRQTLTVYRHRSHSLDQTGGYKSETAMELPFIRHAGEPLALQWKHFVDLAAGRVDAAGEADSYLAPHRLADRLREAALNHQ